MMATHFVAPPRAVVLLRCLPVQQGRACAITPPSTCAQEQHALTPQARRALQCQLAAQGIVWPTITCAIFREPVERQEGAAAARPWWTERDRWDYIGLQQVLRQRCACGALRTTSAMPKRPAEHAPAECRYTSCASFCAYGGVAYRRAGVGLAASVGLPTGSTMVRRRC
jgi:hypothetical protein